MKNPSFYPVAAIIAVIILFFLFFVLKKYLGDRDLFIRRLNHPLSRYIAEKFSGFLLFGFIPFVIFICLSGISLAEAGIVPGGSLKYSYHLLVIMVMISVITYIGSGKKMTRERYPQVRMKIWSLKDLLFSLFGWFAYILGYEFLFRGILWFSCFHAFGFFPALLINTVLYSLAHLDQGLEMSVGSVPAGIVLCGMAAMTGSFIYPFLIHFWMAMNNELFCIFRNPDIRLVFKKTTSSA